ncbi:39S ribosomal protein L23, mitochondrial isoform X2 [Acinonyx jubatus]|uniref:Large ribosomal subunit protein uL23m n=1 Tax=Acinonyx jubatus TaxID=32536 RepID=A0ABM3NH32_ACIJB|nr:39S ribosomal protein L23, mitochondrial isoform X2 [Acinonyx jubatus]
MARNVLMTRVDVRNYLERIYNVPVAAVRTRVQHGSNRKRDYRNVRMKKPDYKVAYVQLARTFAPETLAACPSRGLRAGGPRCPCPLLGAVLEALPFLCRRTDRPSRSPICFPRKSRALTAALATKTSRTGSWMSSGGGRAGTRGMVVSPAGSACDGPNKVLRVE